MDDLRELLQSHDLNDCLDPIIENLASLGAKSPAKLNYVEKTDVDAMGLSTVNMRA